VYFLTKHYASVSTICSYYNELPFIRRVRSPSSSPPPLPLPLGPHSKEEVELSLLKEEREGGGGGPFLAVEYSTLVSLQSRCGSS
jgi:hypothetical protein